jgi:DNA invertase Pin-like site-specific DNA recombinase
MTSVIFTRVSTNVQDNERQVQELKQYASNMNIDVLNVYKEKISGAKQNDERPILEDMVSFIKANDVDKVLVWELSRIGRNTIEVLKTIKMLNDNGVSLYIKNYNLETLNEDGSINPLSQFMIQILTSVSEMEKTQIRQRIESGYNQYRQNGGKVGRKSGYKKNDVDVLSQHKDVAKLLKQGLSVRKVMKLTGKSSGTVQKVSKLIM